MPLPIAVGVALGAFFRWVATQIARMGVQQIIAYMIGTGIAFLLKDLIDVILEKFKDTNGFFNQKLSIMENFTFEKLNDVYTFYEDLITWFRDTVDSMLSTFVPDDAEEIFRLINFGAWIDSLFLAITKTAGEFVEGAVSIAITPLRASINSIKGKIDAVQREIKDVENRINQGIIDLINSVTNQLASIGKAVDDYNRKVLAGGIKRTKIYAETLIPVDRAITASEHTAIISQLHARMKDEFTFLELADLLTPPSAEDNLIRIELKTLDGLVEEITAMATRIEELPASVRESFEAGLPGILKTGFEAHIRNLFIVAMARVLLTKRKAISDAFDRKVSGVAAKKEEIKQSIIEMKQEVIASLDELERKLASDMPDILKPALIKGIEKLYDHQTEMEDAVMINIDKFVPDTSAIDHLIETFPDIKANPQPNIKDSRCFEVQDIYRILCNNCSRTERIALIVHLAGQDLDIGLSEMYSITQQ